jgi:tRNA pseudouridine32 synthase / 23S rRNA pseudouridine746 synthase
MFPRPYAPPAGAPEIVFADAALIVANKPSGLLSVPGRGKDDCLVSRLQTRFADALTVHRLDMETSGLIVLGRGADAQRQLSVAFQQREVGKRYVAVVAGRLTPAAGEIRLPLIADWENRPRQKVDHQLGKPSLTRYRSLAYDEATATTRVALEPATGRSHQLRVHLQALGHPILGDPLYADPAARSQAPRLLLHAEFLAFMHPTSGLPLVFNCPPPF